MRVLIACEESQTECLEFRKLGHECYSCDIQECSGEHPEWHICQDVLPLLNGNCEFKTMDGQLHKIEGKWDMIIAHPPCTDLSVSGARHFEKKRADGRQRASIEFFCQFLDIDCDRVCVENPVNIISGNYIVQYFPDLCKKYNLPRKPSQFVQPYQFGDKRQKKTAYWLKGLPKLVPTDIVEPELVTYIKKDGTVTRFDKMFCLAPSKDRGKIRSKSFEGISRAMAEQWGGTVNGHND